MTAEPKQLPIEVLIAGRMVTLNLTPNEQVPLCGYKNGSKGQRRLQELCRGNIDEAKQIIAGVPTALEVSEAVVSHDKVVAIAGVNLNAELKIVERNLCKGLRSMATCSR